MVLVGGPRQVGKTTLAKGYLKSSRQYLSWEDLEDRALLKSHKIDPELGIVALDEIHKYARWRTLIKGLFDKYQNQLSIIVTGSARLDHFRKGGDSLAGRYHYYRLHPLTLAEVDRKYSSSSLQDLLRFGGFPEPFLQKSEREYKRWQRERLSRVAAQDIADLGTVKEISLIELLVDLLPARVGSPLSIKSLQEDLEVSPNTVSRWVQLLEAVYYCYRILPYGTPKIRAVKKSNKLYLWDWAQVEEPGARFENLVAGHLLKYCHLIEDTQGHKMELRFLRDVDLREIDFVVLKDKKPVFAVECKSGDKNISSAIRYYRQRTTIPKFYQVHMGERDFVDRNCRVLPFRKFCKIESIP
ncbi:MAG: ATP-binding protein [Bradymonadales bacterium]|nr:MAG: ATP-binding protein [Bradymonadales bacterium]